MDWSIYDAWHRNPKDVILNYPKFRNASPLPVETIRWYQKHMSEFKRRNREVVDRHQAMDRL